MTDLSYPIGKFHFAGPLTEEQKQQAIGSIARRRRICEPLSRGSPRRNSTLRTVPEAGQCGR